MNAGATASTRSSLTNTEVPSAFTPVTTRLMDMDASLSTYAPPCRGEPSTPADVWQ